MMIPLVNDSSLMGKIKPNNRHVFCLLISNTLTVLQTKRRPLFAVEMPSILFNENMSAVSLIYFIIAMNNHPQNLLRIIVTLAEFFVFHIYSHRMLFKTIMIALIIQHLSTTLEFLCARAIKHIS